MKIEHIIQYLPLLLTPFFLMWCHNWLISSIEQIDQQLATAREGKVAISLTVFIGILLLMLFITPSLQDIFLNEYGLLAIGFSLSSSFLIIRFFLSTLKEIKCQPLFFKLFINQNFWLSLFFIIATELSILYWIKEINIYVQEQMIIFVIGYVILISISGIFLGIPKRKMLRQEWRLILITIIDPIIIVVFSLIFLQMVLYAIYKIL
ncbi:MAG: hypothetical protein KAI83_10325 [Thiomargarita sp.]|nr:hypothetical protein [Thiomargarita sp.]